MTIKPVVMVGNGSYAKMMNQYRKTTGLGPVRAYAVDTQCINEREIDGTEVISFEEMRERFSRKDYDLMMGIGYREMSQIRKRIFEQCKLWGYHFENYIHPSAMISPDAYLGEGNNILEGVIIEVGCAIGDANLFFGGSMVAHDCNIGSYNTFSVRATAAGAVTIGNNCFLGALSVVKDHVVFQDYVLLGAAAYGFKSMEAYSVIEPAKSRILEERKSVDFL